MTNKHGTVKLFTFSFEIDAPNIISCAPKIFSCAPKNLHLVAQDSAPKLKFKLWALAYFRNFTVPVCAKMPQKPNYESKKIQILGKMG